MSDKVFPSLLTLPVELVYRIMDHLDDLAVLCSIRNVCRRINTIVDTYYRYQVNFSLIKYLSIRVMQTLTTLNLSGKRITDRKAQQIASTLKYSKVSLGLYLCILYAYLYVYIRQLRR